MATTHNLKRIIAGALLAGGAAVTGLGLAAGTALAEPRTHINGAQGIQWTNRPVRGAP